MEKRNKDCRSTAYREYSTLHTKGRRAIETGSFIGHSRFAKRIILHDHLGSYMVCDRHSRDDVEQDVVHFVEVSLPRYHHDGSVRTPNVSPRST